MESYKYTPIRLTQHLIVSSNVLNRTVCVSMPD